MSRFFGKGHIVALSLIFLTACSVPARQWYIQQIKSPCFTATILYLDSDHPITGLDFELICSSSGTRLYVNSTSTPFPWVDGDLSKTPVVLTIGEQVYTFYAERLMGGQRLLMPMDITEQIVTAMLSNSFVIIEAGSHSSEITPAGFTEIYVE